MKKILVDPLEDDNTGVCSVSWLDGTHDNSRKCTLCESRECKLNSRVHVERYKIITSKIAREWDLNNPVI